MGVGGLPDVRVFNTAFRTERGIDDVVQIDVIEIAGHQDVRLVIESTNSSRRQGVWLKSEKPLVINGEECPSASIWSDTAPSEVLIKCQDGAEKIYVYNIWEGKAGRSSLSYSSGMLVEETSNMRRYRCNDIGFETDFSSIVFRIELL